MHLDYSHKNNTDNDVVLSSIMQQLVTLLESDWTRGVASVLMKDAFLFASQTVFGWD